MLRDVLTLLLEYEGAGTVFGGDLEREVDQLLAKKEGRPLLVGADAERIRVVMKMLFDLRLVTALPGVEEGEVWVHTGRVTTLLDLIKDWTKSDQSSSEGDDPCLMKLPMWG